MAEPKPTPPPPSATVALGIAYLVLSAFLIYTLAAFWPSGEVTQQQAGNTIVTDWDPNVTWLGKSFQLPTETRLLWIVVLAGALGSYIHTVTSFATFVGNRTFSGTWIWWYLLRPPIGVSLALLFYFAVRGGFLSSGAVGSDVSPYGVAALAGLVGMFSKQAADKLRETFDNLFRTAQGQGDDQRRDKLHGSEPVITALDPVSLPANRAEASVTVKGRNFSAAVVGAVDGVARPTEFRSESELVVRLQPEDTASPGTLDITVRAGPSSTDRSNTVQLEVLPVEPAPSTSE